MKTLLAAAMVLLATAALAEPEEREFEVKRLDIEAPDGRIAATTKGFVTLEHVKTGERIVHRDRDGKEVAELARTDRPVESWWVAPDGGTVAYLGADDKVIIQVVSAESAETEPFFDGTVSFSSNGRRIAFRTETSIVARDVAPKGWRVEIPASQVAEGPLWSGDGKSLVVIGGELKAMKGAPESPPDAVYFCDPFAEKPEWKQLFRSEGAPISHLGTDPSDRRAAFIDMSDSRGKLRLYDLDQGQIRVHHGFSGTRSISFTPGGDLLMAFNTQNGRNGAMLIGRADSELISIPSGALRETHDDVLVAASASGRDIWLVIHPEGKETTKVVRVTQK
jgi:hypothetical protein